MFEVTSGGVPSSWRVGDPYGTGVLITLQPEPWLQNGFWERKGAGETQAFETFRREVARMYEEEGEIPPDAK
jgi:hypothetical protein